MTTGSARHPVQASLSALLLSLQALGGAGVALAHARDVFFAPNAIEAHHTAQCAVLHDEARCVLGQYARSLTGAHAARVAVLVSRRPTVRSVPRQLAARSGDGPASTTRSRSPPPVIA
ncbi:MAG TPA: hypothetical protein VFK78_03505 [Gemmatimonadales bacterium]|nr:hypothetical protein [Gemmatimonadales bacterium]